MKDKHGSYRYDPNVPVDNAWNNPDYDKSDHMILTLRCSKKLVEKFKSVSIQKGYLNKSEHLRALMIAAIKEQTTGFEING